MQIISKRYLIFKKEPFKKLPDGGMTVNRGTEKCHVPPTAAGEFQNVPDWVRDTTLYKMAITDGTIIEVEVKTPTPAKQPDGNNDGQNDNLGLGAANDDEEEEESGKRDDSKASKPAKQSKGGK